MSAAWSWGVAAAVSAEGRYARMRAVASADAVACVEALAGVIADKIVWMRWLARSLAVAVCVSLCRRCVASTGARRVSRRAVVRLMCAWRATSAVVLAQGVIRRGQASGAQSWSAWWSMIAVTWEDKCCCAGQGMQWSTRTMAGVGVVGVASRERKGCRSGE